MDRISYLPDEVLSHILSFLPTKLAVGTSVLSTRWTYLCASLSSLDFDDSFLLNPRHGTENQELANSFINFVRRVIILHRDSCIDKFHLKCGESIPSLHIIQWMEAALILKVKEMDICISRKRFSWILKSFDCNTLVVLKLGVNIDLGISTKVYLPNLKTLHFNSIEFTSDKSVETLLSSCPLLEDLVIKECRWKYLYKIKISSHTLKRLTIDNSNYIAELYSFELADDFELGKHEILVDAPNLAYFKYMDYMAEDYCLINLHSLVEAHISFILAIDQTDDLYYVAAAKFIRSISKVQSLYLSDDAMEVISLSMKEPWPVFRTLTYLKLGDPLVLENVDYSPRLEHLVLETAVNNYCFEEDDLDPRFWYVRLKFVEILSFRRCEGELRLISYLLSTAPALKRLTIHAGPYKRIELKTLKDLLRLRRVSRRCQIVVV